MIAKRELTVRMADGTEETALLILGAPNENADGSYFCKVTISGSALGSRELRAVGEDSLQAIVLALRVAAAWLDGTTEGRAGRINWLGQGSPYGLL